ncbi:hypothetical protein SI65_01404 [Aspergillus cristatus]|uniref:Deoxyribonuclease NucA/NucB domain-containing protein n=1 Tax=Aspergillus cristatus TaxID=573508 RepID=A0A1E3BSB1_ASPCR|nr:hypothetical protein SI65_01404 [Aspergillus cristatus]
MHFFNLLLTVFFTAGAQQALAAPVDSSGELEARELVIRATPGESESNPINLEIEVEDDSALPFDGDCWAILCKNAPTVLQRNPDEATPRQTGNGVSKNGPKGTGPFRNAGQKGNAYEKVKAVPAPNGAISSLLCLPRNYPFASVTQGGYGAHLLPATEGSQSTQGGKLNGRYFANNVDKSPCGNSWFKVTGFKAAAGATLG